MENKIKQFHVLIRFKDPDNLPGSFTTENYLEGYIVSMIPGPNENNWVIRLKYPIQCYDDDRNYYVASTFLLKPIGMDNEKIMKKSPWDITDTRELSAFALLLKEEEWPLQIDKPEDYKKYPVINAAIIRVDKSTNFNFEIV